MADADSGDLDELARRHVEGYRAADVRETPIAEPRKPFIIETYEDGEPILPAILRRT